MSTGAGVLQVNVGRTVVADWTGRAADPTAFIKQGVAAPVLATRTGLVGDEVGDTVHHGGPDMAVYAFASEDLMRWSRLLGGPLRPGDFAENLTTVGIDVNAARVGERWQVGGALLEISKVRIPCYKFAARIAQRGFDSAGWIRRFTADARPGPYFRVLVEGPIAAGSPIEVVHRPDHGITVSDMFRILTTEQHRKAELLRIDGLAASVRAKIDQAAPPATTLPA